MEIAFFAGGITFTRCRIEYAIEQVKESVMKPTRLARNLMRVSLVATTAMTMLTPRTSAWAQQPEKPAAPVAAPQTQQPAPAAAPQTPAPAETPSAGDAQPVPPPPSNDQPIPAPPTGAYPPPGSGPPPGVPYHYYYNHPGYPGYSVAPLRPVTYRPFMFGVGLGMGSLAFSSSSITKHEAAMAYSVRLGFSITARWMALFAMDGSWAQFSFSDPTLDPYGKRSVAATSYTAGAQFFILRWMYARMGLGLACLEWSDDYGDWSDCHGQTASGAVGAEFLQTRSTAVAAELGGFVSRFPDASTISDRNDIWYHIGVNLILNLF